ncbi:hypothetical protein PANG_00056 [Paenibacillus phage PG1]|uniref:hypothetical protein n=1 Tax=Paenibacillus phage PG1 TaxID=754053 RepID=UPI00034289FC|nr:hypothetical protein PANG_00056 [Paenibacillus phage PG1]AGN33775.1 hypothetical protein PANG_00056 [Paenibacillus phage PG1]
MKQDEILALEPGIELDKIVAVQVMGWEIRQEDLPDHQSYREYYYRNGEKYENVDYPDHWQPSKYIDAAWEVEEQIKTLGLCVEYCQALKQVVVSTGEYVGLFDYIHATPEQRCKAALLAVLEEEEA